jgi:cell division protein FtsA
MRHYASIPFGGRSVTQDIKSELQITEQLAENIKLAFGACIPEKLQNMSEKVLHIMDKNSDQDKQVPVKYLSEIITARMEEIIEAVLYEIQESGLAEHLRCGIVITGGAAQTTNLGMLINEMSGYKVRIGYPKSEVSDYDVDGTHDASAAPILGLLSAALKEEAINCAIETYGSEEKKETEEKTEEKMEEEMETEILTGEEETLVEEETQVEEQGHDEEEEHKEIEEEKKPKEDKWRFLKVFWGKAQSIGENLNGLIDDITDEKVGE